MALAVEAGRQVVLVVEDDMGMRALYREVLTRRGVEVVETGDGSEVVGLVRRYAPAVVLLDAHLPGLNGREVLKALRSDAELRSVPVIAATGMGADDADEWMAAGFDDVLFKPIRLNDLIAAVQRFLA